MMKAYKVTGTFLMGKNYEKFSKEVVAKDEKGAREFIYSELGSKHKVNRRKIDILKIDPLKKGEVQNTVVKHILGE